VSRAHAGNNNIVNLADHVTPDTRDQFGFMIKTDKFNSAWSKCTGARKPTTTEAFFNEGLEMVTNVLLQMHPAEAQHFTIKMVGDVLGKTLSKLTTRNRMYDGDDSQQVSSAFCVTAANIRATGLDYNMETNRKANDTTTEESAGHANLTIKETFATMKRQANKDGVINDSLDYANAMLSVEDGQGRINNVSQLLTAYANMRTKANVTLRSAQSMGGLPRAERKWEERKEKHEKKEGKKDNKRKHDSSDSSSSNKKKCTGCGKKHAGDGCLLLKHKHPNANKDSSVAWVDSKAAKWANDMLKKNNKSAITECPVTKLVNNKGEYEDWEDCPSELKKRQRTGENTEADNLATTYTQNFIDNKDNDDFIPMQILNPFDSNANIQLLALLDTGALAKANYVSQEVADLVRGIISEGNKKASTKTNIDYNSNAEPTKLKIETNNSKVCAGLKNTCYLSKEKLNALLSFVRFLQADFPRSFCHFCDF
jgi:hypothetical protein